MSMKKFNAVGKWAGKRVGRLETTLFFNFGPNLRTRTSIMTRTELDSISQYAHTISHLVP